MRFPLIVPVADTRYAVLGRFRATENVKRQIVWSKKHLTQKDLIYHFYNPVATIANAAAVYFGTDSANQFAELIDFVVGSPADSRTTVGVNETRPERHVFIDLSALKSDSRREVAHAVKACRNAIKALPRDNDARDRCDHAPCSTCLSVMVKSDESTRDQHWRDLGLREGMDVLLVYDDKRMLVIGKEKDKPRVEAVPYDSRPGPRDAFIAGFLLHRAVAAAWRCIPH